MRISDWSSDVCSSDLRESAAARAPRRSLVPRHLRLSAAVTLSDDQLSRYARHIVLKEIGGAGQTRLLASTVALVGAGGIGSPAIQYLAGAGVGTLIVIDDDSVDLSNLQRQTLYATADQIGSAPCRERVCQYV